MAIKGYKMTEEHKRKISEANKGKIISIEIRNKISETNKRKGIRPKNVVYLKREQHPLWKTGRLTYRKICQDNEKDLNTCEICNWIEKNNFTVLNKKIGKKMGIHHIDGNRNSNKIQNLAVVCSYCHNAIHDNQNRKMNRFQEGHINYNKPRKLIEVTA